MTKQNIGMARAIQTAAASQLKASQLADILGDLIHVRKLLDRDRLSNSVRVLQDLPQNAVELCRSGKRIYPSPAANPAFARLQPIPLAPLHTQRVWFVVAHLSSSIK